MTETRNQTVYKGSPLSTLMVALLVGAAFIIGTLYSRVQSLETQVTGGQVAGTVNQGNNAGNVGGTGNTQPVAQPTRPVVTAESIAPVTEEDHIRGSINAPIKIVEYSDTDCPFCAQFHPTMQQVVDEYGEDQVAWVYRHFPIPQLHPGAPLEAQATECVAEIAGEDAFWTYLDEVINQTLNESGLVSLAEQQGVNRAEMQDCLETNRTQSIVDAQFQTGVEAGVQGTPAAYVVTDDGRVESIPGALPFAQVKAIIDGLL